MSDKVDREDWRLQAVTSTTKPFKKMTGEYAPIGSPVVLASLVECSKKIYGFKMPSMTALFLDFSYNAFESGIKELKELLVLSELNHQGINNIRDEDEEKLFEAFEMIMASIVFSFSALETFANENIPENYIFRVLNDDGKFLKEYNKSQIEENLSLDIKLGEILPTLMGVINLKVNVVWKKYKELKKFRDRIIHMKSNDRKSSEPKDDTIWKELFCIIDKNNFSLDVLDFLKYFYKGKEPRWILKFPYK